MKRLLATCVVALLIAGTANAQLRIFFDNTPGAGVDLFGNRTIPTAYGNPVVDPAVPGSERLYIYAEFLGENDLWIAANFDITVDGGSTVAEVARYNAFTRFGLRWTGPAVGGTVGPANVGHFRSAKILNPALEAGGIWNWDQAESTRRIGNPAAEADVADPSHYRRAWDSQGGGLGTTLLGYVDIIPSAGGSIYLTVEAQIFARLDSTPEDFVNFGYGDDSVGTGEIGVRTSIADATIVPEPASLMLLSLGALALRRRR